MHRTALLAGATGLVGRELLPLLLDDADIAEVVVLARRELATPHPKLLQGIVSFKRLEAYALPAVDDFYCCLGTTMKRAGSQQAFREVDLVYPVRIAKMALDAGATRCLHVSAMGADRESPLFYNRTKGEAEATLSRLPFEAVYALRPSLLAGDRSEFRFAERAALALAQPLSRLLPPRLRPVAAVDVARAMHACGKRAAIGRFVVMSDEIRRLARDAQHHSPPAAAR
jgi:uncharacterized protein YbjT (DUF2867 family)